MGGSCGMHSGEGKCIQSVGCKTSKKKTTWKTYGLRGDIKIYLKETEWEDMDWIHLDQDRDRWQAPVNMDLWVLHITCRDFLEQLRN
jgi:hypothetical protein